MKVVASLSAVVLEGGAGGETRVVVPAGSGPYPAYGAGRRWGQALVRDCWWVLC